MLFVLLVTAGCVTKSKAAAQARAAFAEGQRQGMAAQANATSVWVVGNVRTPIIPWTADLTLAKALVAAEYLGEGDPSKITLYRQGRAPFNVSPKQLLQGYDLPLKLGDRLEVKP